MSILLAQKSKKKKMRNSFSGIPINSKSGIEKQSSILCINTYIFQLSKQLI